MTTPIAVAAAPAATNGAASSAQTPAAGAPPPATSDGKTPAQAAPPKPAAEQPWKAKRKLVLNGKEVEREYDDRRLQILEHTAAQKADFEREQSEFKARMKQLEEDPDGFLEEAGFDWKAYEQHRAAREQEMKSLTPEEIRARTAEDKLAKYEASEKKRIEREGVEAEQREHQGRVQANVQRLGKAIELSGLPRSGELVRLYAEVQELAAHAGEPEMTPEQVVSAGERLMTKRLTTLLKAASNEGWRTRNAPLLAELGKAVLPALEGDALIDWVGPEHTKRIVAASYARLKRSPTPIVQETPRDTPAGAPPPNGRPVVGWDEAAEKFGF